MFGHRYQTLALVLLGASTFAGCSSAETAPEYDAQQEAINRWTRCIERYSDYYKGPFLQLGKRANRHCEGYQRDLLAIYPPHLKNQIESLLSQRAHTITTARVIKTGNSTSLSGFNGSNLDTLKLRLMEAHQADL